MTAPREVLCSRCKNNTVLTSAEEAICLPCMEATPESPAKPARNHFKSRVKRGDRTAIVKAGLAAGKTTKEIVNELKEKYPNEDRRHLSMIVYTERRRSKKAVPPTPVPEVAPPAAAQP